MPTDSLLDLIELLRHNRLLPPDRLHELKQTIQPRFVDPRALGKYLVQRGWLTVYQVNRLMQGDGRDLVLGPYQILDRLGEGGVSNVYKAWDTSCNCPAALKLIRPDMLSNAEAVGRFRREIQVVTQLSHPNVVKAFGFSLEGDRPFLAMEYVEGNDLGKLVQLSGPLPLEQACEYTRQAALGLHHAHERGLIHRDVKPQNLLVTEQGRVVKVLDLGLARLQRSPGQAETVNRLTRDGVVIGTPDYLAPEQARNPRSVDARADLYSLGCTLYYLLAGQPPFPGNSVMKKLLQHQQTAPDPVESLRPGLPAALSATLQKLLAKHPGDRHQTGAELAVALAPFCRPA
jgi:serine/threonine protein kinase